MKIKLSEHIKEDTLLGRLILSGMAHAIEEGLPSKIRKEREASGDDTVEIKLTANGHELDIEEFTERWQAYVEERVARAVKETVTETADEAVEGLVDLLSELKTHVHNKVNGFFDEVAKKDK